MLKLPNSCENSLSPKKDDCTTVVVTTLKFVPHEKCEYMIISQIIGFQPIS